MSENKKSATEKEEIVNAETTQNLQSKDSEKSENLPEQSSSENFDWDKLESEKVQKQSLNHEYLKMEEGEVIKGIMTGIFNQMVSGKEMECATFITKEGARFSAAHMVVQAFRKLKEGDGVEIVYLGKKNIGGGRSLGDYEVYKLSI